MTLSEFLSYDAIPFLFPYALHTSGQKTPEAWPLSCLLNRRTTGCFIIGFRRSRFQALRCTSSEKESCGHDDFT